MSTRNQALIKISKVGAGTYETDAGHLIEWKAGSRFLGTRSGWFVTFPGEHSPDLSFPTLRAARQYVTTPEGTP